MGGCRMELKDMLIDLSHVVRLKSIKFRDNGSVESLELYPLIQIQEQPKVEPQSTEALVNDMPPDDVMLYASSPVFDQMVDEAKVSPV